VHKAHYVLMNIECDGDTLHELEDAFRYNDAVLRNLIVAHKGPVTEASPLAKAPEGKESVAPEARTRPPEAGHRAIDNG